MENEAQHSDQPGYTVVARRYRPKSFSELIGQDHISQALSKAIESGRVGHAYLFTGARGVGKTSTARIFAKVLNTPADLREDVAADISQSVDSGEDMDVIEIDGASNRGIDEIRQLRANVSVRPSRSPFKIYIIDEVHMLTGQAFNALLKTLEEPPAHVKFIFCTTDPDKIPITVLSRCQRFDFVPIKFEAIQSRLKEICEAEGFSAQDEALALLARRASGSMRDSQSLLEQVMSFSTEQITAEGVHCLLGTADEGRLKALVQAMRDADALAAINLIDETIRGGTDAGQLAEQLLGYLRDIMAVGIGGGPELLKFANPAGHSDLQTIVEAWGVQTVLSAIQILDESLVRMRSSVSAVTLMELAVVQICRLEQLASIPELLDRVLLQPASTPRTAAAQVQKKKDLDDRHLKAAGREPSGKSATAEDISRTADENLPAAELAESFENQPTASKALATAATAGSNPSAGSLNIATPPLHEVQSEPKAIASGGENLPAQASPPSPRSTVQEHPVGDAIGTWRTAVSTIDGMLADYASLAQTIDQLGADHWRVVFPPGGTKPSEYCGDSQRKEILQSSLGKQLGRSIRLTFTALPSEASERVAAVPQSNLRAQKMREVAEHPYVKQLCEVLDGEILRVDAPRATAVPPMKSTQTSLQSKEKA